MLLSKCIDIILIDKKAGSVNTGLYVGVCKTIMYLTIIIVDLDE